MLPASRYLLPCTILHLTYLLSGLHYPRGTHTNPRSNTAQILTSLVEATTDPRSNHSPDALSLLEEALGLFQRCLALQEYQHTESQSQSAAISNDASMDDFDLPDAEDGGVSLTSEEPQDDRWATILEPVTKNTLLDTLLAQVETLTLLCNLIPASSEPNLLSFIAEYSSNLLSEYSLALSYYHLILALSSTLIPLTRSSNSFGTSLHPVTNLSIRHQPTPLPDGHGP
jgi:hypothetical protein